MARTRLRICALLLVPAATFAPTPAQNLVVDGDLEGHTATGCVSGTSPAQFNALFLNVHSIAGGGVDVVQGSCWGSSPPQSGATSLCVAGHAGVTETIAMELVTTLSPGATYSLSFWAENMPFVPAQPFEIGLSNTVTAFGVAVFTATPTPGWTQYGATITAPLGATFLTARPRAGGSGWIAFDDFRLEGATAATNTVIGNGCNGPVLLASTRPITGTDWDLDLFAIPGGAVIAFMLVDTVNPNQPLGGQGAPGCTQFSGGAASTLLGLPVPVPSYTLAIPPGPALIGLPLNAQGGALVPGVNPLGLAASNGVLGVIGDV